MAHVAFSVDSRFVSGIIVPPDLLLPFAVPLRPEIFVQSAFLVHQLPEKWSLQSWTGWVELWLCCPAPGRD